MAEGFGLEHKQGRHGPEAAWRSIVGPTPRLGPDDRKGAAAFVYKVQQALNQGGWRKGERVRLHKLKRLWTARTEGRDERYVQYGNRDRGRNVDGEFWNGLERRVRREPREIERRHGRESGSKDEGQGGGRATAGAGTGADQEGRSDHGDSVRADSEGTGTGSGTGRIPPRYGWGR